MHHTLDTSIVETALNEFGGMIRALATEFGYPYEDLRQEIALLMLEQLHMLPHDRLKLKCYLRTCTKRLLIDQYHLCSRIQTVSLDEPLNEESDTSLADLLAVPPDQTDQDTTNRDQKVTALYAALSRLPLDEQRYVREVYDLNAYQPIIYDYSKREKNRKRNAISAALYKHLRKDAQLASEVLS